MIRQPGDPVAFGRSFGLDCPGVMEWLFCPGMMFQSTVKWWGDRTGSRPRPHEGVDLLLYRSPEGKIGRIDPGVAIPALSEGVICGVIADFLGRSVIVEHPVPGINHERRYSIYAHTRPGPGMGKGTRVGRGDAIATVAAPEGNRRFPMAPHLHLSIAWAPRPISCDRIDWNAIAAQKDLILLDPLAVIAMDHRLLPAGDPACQDL